MEAQLLFYKSAVPVSSEVHKDLSVRTDAGFAFAHSANSVPLVAAEFRAASLDYTIVFAGEADQMIPTVILGLKDGENQYLGADGQWNGRYVPAFVRRYPFVFAASDDGDTFTLCIDDQYDGCNRDGEGEALFDSRGEQTQYLKNVLDFTREYQAQFARTRAFCDRLVELDLLDPMHAEYTTPQGEARRLTGFSAVNRDKVKALTGDVLERMLKTDELELLFIHLQSMNNLQPLLERSAQMDGETAEQTIN